MNKAEHEHIPRPEYPRPQFVRDDNWLNLNGEWGFTFDDSNVGLREKWYKQVSSTVFDEKIIVPFCFQSKLSGIEDTSFHEIIWYRREFKVPEILIEKRTLLHFGAVDYSCIVYLNGEYVGSHEGGYIGFSLDVTDFIEENNVLVVRVEDPSQDLEIPRGKQYWKQNLERIFYPRVSGIWQTVWLEFVSSESYLKKIKITSNIEKAEIVVEFNIFGTDFSELSLLLEVLYNNQPISNENLKLDFLGKLQETKFKPSRVFLKTQDRFKLKIVIPKDELFLWDNEHPNLYDLTLKIRNDSTGDIYDSVKSYFGMRKISTSEIKPGSNKQVLLNNKPIYQKLFLVQGYWPDGLYTAPKDEDIIKDIQYIMDFGFNGLRTHQKSFDPRFLYWCDKMGVLVWGEIGNSFIFTVDSQMRLINQFVEEIERDYNHPSIITWVPINESWGVQGSRREFKRADYTRSLYHLIKSIDSTRLVVDDDGWWHTKTDICTRHFYMDTKYLPDDFEDEIKSHRRAAPKVYLKPYKYTDEPIIYSEIGGFGFDLHGTIDEKWGYGNLSETSDDLFEKILNLMGEFDKRKNWIHGFCYTELYDQFQEINGFLTFNREPKFPPSKLKAKLEKMFYVPNS
ncbi:MAG: glycoside hydrolase family 2 protein, partial [Promethearchaeota archaeon]|jgi:beta-galactosidase/beta-glucuronidase